LAIRAALSADDEESRSKASAETVGEAREKVIAGKIVEEVGTDGVPDQIRTKGVLHIVDRLDAVSLGDNQTPKFGKEPTVSVSESVANPFGHLGVRTQFDLRHEGCNQPFPENLEAEVIVIVGGKQPEVVLDRMSGRNMAKIMQKAAEPGKDSRLCPLAIALIAPLRNQILGRMQPLGLTVDAVEKMLGQPEGTKAVREASVDGTGIDEVGLAELANSAQALKGRTIDTSKLKTVEMDISVNWISEYLGRPQKPVGQTPGFSFSLGLCKSPIGHPASILA
jgi:hypothetical protein